MANKGPKLGDSVLHHTGKMGFVIAEDTHWVTLRVINDPAPRISLKADLEPNGDFWEDKKLARGAGA